MTVIWIPKSFKGKIKEMTRAKKIVFEIFIFHTLNMAALNTSTLFTECSLKNNS